MIQQGLFVSVHCFQGHYSYREELPQITMDNSNLNHTKFLISFTSLQKCLLHSHHVTFLRGNFKKDLPTFLTPSFRVNLDSDKMQSVIFWY